MAEPGDHTDVSGVVIGFVTLGSLIAVGWFIAWRGLADEGTQRALATVAFHVATPALLVTTLSRADVNHLFTANLLAAAAGAAVAALLYAVPARLLWHRAVGETAVGALAAAYVNAGYLGIPVAAYVLGDAALVAPVLVLQTLAFQPLALAILDAERLGHRPSLWAVLRLPLTNPITLGALAGVGLSLAGRTLPTLAAEPLRVLGGFAVPAILLAYGIALRVGSGLGGEVPRVELALTTGLKLVAQPLTAYVVARLFGVEGPALLAVAVISALPTAQNIFVHATRYRRAETLARDTILLTTVGSVPVIVGLVWLLG